jgi:peroxiredoxin Q/BCP
MIEFLLSWAFHYHDAAIQFGKKTRGYKMLKEGTNAPAFKTTDANGETVSLKDLRGQKVVLYFYPKDDTPGCTKEACSFRDDFAKFKKRGIAVLGVSPDSEKSHKKFETKHKLPIMRSPKPTAFGERRSLWGERIWAFIEPLF